MTLQVASEVICISCRAPMRPPGIASEEMRGRSAKNLARCTCVAGKPSVIARFSVHKAMKMEPSLHYLLVGTAYLPEASIFPVKAKDYPAIVPEEFHDTGLCIVRLPAFVEPQLQTLAVTSLRPITVRSEDLMRESTHLRWTIKDLAIHFPMALVDSVFFEYGERPRTLLLLISARSVLLALHPLTLEFFSSLQAVNMHTGQNYRPHSRWSAEDFECAAAIADIAKPAFAQEMDDGFIALELQGGTPQVAIQPYQM